MLNQVYLGIGGNLGNRSLNIQLAIDHISSLGEITSQSAIIETKAWGITDRPNYLNCAIVLRTKHYPLELLKKLKVIEKKIGRVPSQKWDSRIIDIDILYFNDWKFDLPELQVPHPHIQDRDFVLIPMEEIAPNLIHPKHNLSQASLLKKLIS